MNELEKRFKSFFKESYQQERELLSPLAIDSLLEAGRAWSLAPFLEKGGTLIFPHTYMKICGPFIAAVVHACLDCGAPKVVVLGVLHALNDTLFAARQREKRGEDLSQEQTRGIFGPGILGEERAFSYWQEEFSLLSFLFLWEHEVRRRRITPPELVVRYPFLADRRPGELPRMDELKKQAQNAVVVATADLCHHGVAYGNSMAMEISKQASQYAFDTIHEGLRCMEGDSFEAYYDHCLKAQSDAFDVGACLRYLLGPLCGSVCGYTLVDTAPLYEMKPSPSWVAASLIALEPLTNAAR
jgi:hypothetical protein